MSQTVVETIYPASAQQQGMLFETMAAPASGVHVEQLTSRIEGDLDLPAFERAWQSLLRRHAVLRTAFAWQDQPRPLQMVIRDAVMPLAIEDWRDVPPDEVEARLQALLDADRGQGFQMSKAPLMRLKLLRTGERSALLVWTHHHILMDGWCRPVLLGELAALYEAGCRGTELALPASLPYREYIAWLGRQDTAGAEEFWRRELRGFRHPTPLGRPAAAPLAEGSREEAATLKRRLPAPQTAALEALAQGLRVTLSTVVQAAWALLLGRYGGELDVVFGVTVSGRPAELPGIETAIGLFINTLPLRVRIEPEAAFASWLARLQAHGLELRRHEHVASGQAHRWSDVPAAFPLYESILVFENYPDVPAAVATAATTAGRDGLAIRVDGSFASGGRTRRPATVLITPGDELACKLVYDTRRLHDGGRLLDHFLLLLAGIAGDPEASVASLQALIPEAQIPEFSLAAAPGAAASDASPPRTSVEELAALLWSQVLGLPQVGIEEDFFALGGHSLIAADLVGLAREAFQVDLPLRALFEHPTVAGMAAEIARRQGTPQEHAAQLAALPELVPDPAGRHQPFPLTDLQEAYWIGRGGSFEIGNVATHFYQEVDVERLDVARFERAWRRLVARHDMLRAIVLPDGRQQILPQVPPYDVAVLDVRGDAAAAAEERLLAVRERMSHQVLPADRWPLFDIRVSLLAGGPARLHLSIDLLIGDAWSWRLLIRELELVLADEDAELPPLELSYRDYVLAAAAIEGTPLHARSLDYWMGRLAALPPGPELPLAKNPAAIERPRFVRRRRVLEPEAWRRLKERGTRFGLTPSGLLLAVFAEALAAWSKGGRFTINLTLFNRLPLHPQVNRLVGDFTSLTLLEVDAAAAATFEQRARQLQRQLWDDLDHRYVSGVRVLRELGRREGRPARLSMPVVFTSTLTLGGSADEARRPEAHSSALGDTHHVWSVGQTSQVWLDHQVSEQAGSLFISWDAVEELFPTGMLDDMLAACIELLGRLAGGEETWREAAPLRVPAAHLALYAAANATAAPAPPGLLHGPFLEQAARQPERWAVLSPERRLSYGELRRLAAGVGRQLRESGVEEGTLVAVVMSKGWEQVVAALGVLAAGAAYLPIDAELPPERRDGLLRQGEVRVALTQPRWAAALEWPPALTVLAVGGQGFEPADDAAHGSDLDGDGPWSQPPRGAADLAYTLFTSGSTGVPKGVMIEHGAALNTVVDVNRRFAVGPADRVLAVSSLSFDLSVYDLFGLLGAGGAVVLPEAAAARHPGRWLELMDEHAVTVWNTVPALLEMLVEYAVGQSLRLPASLRLVLLSGDWVPVGLPERLRRLCQGPVEVVSLGGATEASIWSILYPIGEVDPSWRSVPYGRAMANQSFEVLDPRLQARPLWVPGELYIGGLGLARGYWRDEEKTAASFVTRPATGERLYRTGDLGRWLPDGTIELLGREDFQVKIHGHRIELGEIEAALARCPGIEAAVVTADADGGEPPYRRQLAAYVVLKPEARRGPAGPSEEPAGWPALPPPAVPEWLARAEAVRGKAAATALRDLPAAGAIELGPEPDAAAVEGLFLARRSCREFTAEPVAVADLGGLLGCLRQLSIGDHPRPKLRYGSAGSLYPVQVYLHLVEGRVRGLAGGTYYYHPGAHRLVPLAPGAQLDAAVHSPVNRAAFSGAAFSIFLVGWMDAILPHYGERGRHFATLEAGAMAQLLETSATAHGLGLCQIGDLDFAAVRPALDLAAGHELLHSLVGGRFEPRSITLAGHREEAAAYRSLLAMMEQREPASSASSSSSAAMELRALLRRQLPDFMVPAHFAFLDRLPLSANGKVDRAALPRSAAKPDRPDAAAGAAPRGVHEELIAAAWREVLHADRVGVDDNFFTLGGHSVTLVRVYNRLREELGREFPLAVMFEHPTIASLARYLDGSPAAPALAGGGERGERRREAALERRARHRPAGTEAPEGSDDA
jgi:amino acid adenylation domain-containing protein